MTTAPTSIISAWTRDGNVLGSCRVDGQLQIHRLGDAEYVAYVHAGSEGTITEAVCVEPDYPGWFKVHFVDYEARKLALEKYGQLLFEGDVSPVRRFLSDHDITIAPPRRCYIDIETDSRVPPREQVPREGFTPPTARILSWALVDEEGHEIVKLLDEDSDEAEARFLAQFWALVERYDQICAWNGDGFDFPVLHHRTRLLAKHRGKQFEAYWENFRRLLFLDQLLCFKRHHMAPESGDDKTSLKLNDVCESILGEGKHDFSARLTWEAWENKDPRLPAYNLQDTVLLRKLEEATGYLQLQQALAELTFTPASSHGLKPMPQVDGYMLRKARHRQTHLPSKKPPTGDEKQYEGAFVMEPSSLGVHRMVHVCDFKSLYPTVIRSLNIGTETKDQLGAQAFGTGVWFGNETESMLAECCRDFMGQRDAYKKKAKADPNNKYYERMSKAYKIANNSVYGVMGSVWSRFYDVQLAESITLGAKALIKATIAAAEARGWSCIYGDTDSVFVTGCTVEEFKEFVAWCNAELYPKMLAQIGANLNFNCIELDYEKCFNRLVFPLGNEGRPVSKRYCGSYEHYAFKPKDKPEIRGLEYMRGDGVRIARHVQKACIDKILAGESSEQLEEWVQGLRHRVMSEILPVEDIMISKGLGQDLDAYSPKSNPAHVRLARELEAAGEEIGQGSRIAYIITDGLASPPKIISADDYDGTFDRHHAWNKQIYPCLQRVLAGAFQDRNWKRWISRRPKRALGGQLDLFAIV